MQENNIYQPEFIPFYVNDVKKLGLTQLEGLAYGFIRFYGKNNSFYFSSKDFAKILGTSKGTIDNIVLKLSKKKIIKTETNRYNQGGVIKSNRKITLLYGNLSSLPDENTISSHSENTISLPDEIKENNKNNNKKKDIYIEVLNHWNSLGIITHTKTPVDFEKNLDKKLKTYTIDEIKNTISKYGEVVLGKEYWFSYKWGIRDFLSRKNGFDTFFDSPKENYLIRRDNFNSPQNALRDEIDIGEFSVGENVSFNDL